MDIDFAGPFPVPTDGAVVQPGVVGGHFGGGVVEDLADDFLGHIIVDQPGAECVAELVGGEVDRYLVFVADVAGQHPGLECGVED